MANIIEITDFNAPELDVYARLTENQLINRHEPEKGLFIAESPKVIERALDAGYIPVSLLLEKKHITGEAAEIVKRCGQIPIFTAEFDVLTKLTGFQLTRGVLCAMRRSKLPAIKDVCANAKRIAVLENIMNPTNIGAIFRSAAALNMDAVLLTTACSNPLYRRAIRVSMGSVFQIPWTYLDDENDDYNHVSSMEHTHSVDFTFTKSKRTFNGYPKSNIARLKQLGFKTAAMALSNNSVSVDHPQLMAEDKLAIILGTEGDGLSPATIEECDYTVCIPMSHNVDSLNVAAASAIAFWQLGKH